QAEDGIRDRNVTGVQTCALPIWTPPTARDKRDRTRAMRNASVAASIPSASASPNSSAGRNGAAAAGARRGKRAHAYRRRAFAWRSEERRVGRGGRAGGAADARSR